MEKRDCPHGEINAITKEIWCEAEGEFCKFMKTCYLKNPQPVICENPHHNVQVDYDGRCHWCESKEIKL